MSDELNEWLNQQLQAKNISMNKLEKMSGIPRGYVSKVLSGERNGGMDFYLKAAKALDAVPEMLSVAGFLSEEQKWDMSLWELFKLVKSLNPEDQKEISELVDFLVRRKQQSETSRETNLATGDA